MGELNIAEQVRYRKARSHSRIFHNYFIATLLQYLYFFHITSFSRRISNINNKSVFTSNQSKCGAVNSLCNHAVIRALIKFASITSLKRDVGQRHSPKKIPLSGRGYFACNSVKKEVYKNNIITITNLVYPTVIYLWCFSFWLKVRLV